MLWLWIVFTWIVLITMWVILGIPALYTLEDWYKSDPSRHTRGFRWYVKAVFNKERY
jgi:hypothetical protein